MIFYWFSYDFQDNDVFEEDGYPGAKMTKKGSQKGPQRVPKAVPIDQKSTSKNSQKIIEKNKCEGKLIEVRVVTKERARRAPGLTFGPKMVGAGGTCAPPKEVLEFSS